MTSTVASRPKPLDRARQDEDRRTGCGRADGAAAADRDQAEDQRAFCADAAHEHADRHRGERTGERDDGEDHGADIDADLQVGDDERHSDERLADLARGNNAGADQQRRICYAGFLWRIDQIRRRRDKRRRRLDRWRLQRRVRKA